MLEELKQRVYEANMLLPKYGLVTFTWGNVSEIDREQGLFAIKPSGVDYDKLTPEDMVIMDLKGNKIEGKYKPSSDTATHIELYKEYEELLLCINSSLLKSNPFVFNSIQTSVDIVNQNMYAYPYCIYLLGKDKKKKRSEELTKGCCLKLLRRIIFVIV